MRKNVVNSFFLIFLAAQLAIGGLAQNHRIDREHSSLTIHVGRAGLFSVAGHEHWVRAPFSDGSFSAKDPAHVTFSIDAKSLTVVPDKDLSSEKQAEVQNTMQSQVLESQKYPEVTFRSTRIDRLQPDHWTVIGDLTLHGQTRSIRVDVKSADGTYTGNAKFKQTNFGIEPVSVGGVVKVKDELEIAFTVVAEKNVDGP